MKRALTGQYITSTVVGEVVNAFVPDPLPPTPPMELGHDIRDRLDRAHIALGRLDGVSGILPDTHQERVVYRVGPHRPLHKDA